MVNVRDADLSAIEEVLLQSSATAPLSINIIWDGTKGNWDSVLISAVNPSHIEDILHNKEPRSEHYQ